MYSDRGLFAILATIHLTQGFRYDMSFAKCAFYLGYVINIYVTIYVLTYIHSWRAFIDEIALKAL